MKTVQLVPLHFARRVLRSATLDIPIDERLLEKRLTQTRAFSRSMVEDEDAEDRMLRFIASDETVDRYGDIIRVDGWELDNYNGAFLYQHDRHDPVGEVTRAWVDKHPVKAGEKALLIDVHFPPDDVDADRVHSRFRNGMLKSVSVSFMPLKVSNVPDPEERKKLRLGQFGVVYERQELLETSAVTVPANPMCNETDMRSLLARGLIQTREFDAARRLVAQHEAAAGLTADHLEEIFGALKELAQHVQGLRDLRSGTPSSTDAVHARSADAPDLFETILSELQTAGR